MDRWMAKRDLGSCEPLAHYQDITIWIPKFHCDVTRHKGTALFLNLEWIQAVDSVNTSINPKFRLPKSWRSSQLRIMDNYRSMGIGASDVIRIGAAYWRLNNDGSLGFGRALLLLQQWWISQFYSNTMASGRTLEFLEKSFYPVEI